MIFRLCFQEPLWLIEQAHSGRYHNSPAVWRDCGFIRAADRNQALTKARACVGSQACRVTPADAVEAMA